MPYLDPYVFRKTLSYRTCCYHVPLGACNTPDMICPICTPTLAVSGFKLFYFLGFGFLSPCVAVVVMHLISCHHVHCICIRVRLMHSSIFPVVCFAFRRSVLLRWSFLHFFHVWGLNISRLDRDLPSGLGLLPVDCLSSFVPFGLRLILQRLTEGPKRPRVCCSRHPSKVAQNPPKPPPSSRSFNHDRVAANRTSFGVS